MLLENKKALVTGGSRGIGRAIALRLAAEGADVAFTYQSNESAASEVAAAVRGFGRNALPLKSDASVQEDVDRSVEDVMREFGRLDVLVNNAGITSDALLMRMSEEQWDKVLDVNLKSAFLYSKAAARPMASQRSGSIINVTSVVGLRGNAGQSNYAASKAGMIGLAKALSKELGKRGVRVNCVAPGFIESDMSSALPGSIKDEWIDDIALRRAGTPDEVAGVVLFLASDLSAYVTGEVINCSGNIKG